MHINTLGKVFFATFATKVAMDVINAANPPTPMELVLGAICANDWEGFNALVNVHDPAATYEERCNMWSQNRS